MLSSCGQVQSPQQNIFFLCAAAGEGLLPERVVNLPNHALLSLRGAHNPGVNIIASIEIFRYSKELVTHRQPAGGTEGWAILSVVESGRRLRVPVRDYFSTILPGLADLPIRCLPDLTPAVWGAQHS
jgi:hypothetical protein